MFYNDRRHSGKAVALALMLSTGTLFTAFVFALAVAVR